MKDYSITLTITVPIQARSLPQAQERAERLAEAALPPITAKRWVDDAGVSYETEVGED